MLSLKNTYDPTGLAAFAQSMRRKLSKLSAAQEEATQADHAGISNAHPSLEWSYCCEQKFDGVAINLQYEPVACSSAMGRCLVFGVLVIVIVVCVCVCVCVCERP
jgi:NAD-dependent DNA ligase